MKIPVASSRSQLPAIELCLAIPTGISSLSKTNEPGLINSKGSAINYAATAAAQSSNAKRSAITKHPRGTRQLTRARYNLLMRDKNFLTALPKEDLEWFKNLFRGGNQKTTSLDLRTALYLQSLYAKTRSHQKPGATAAARGAADLLPRGLSATTSRFPSHINGRRDIERDDVRRWPSSPTTTTPAAATGSPAFPPTLFERSFSPKLTSAAPAPRRVSLWNDLEDQNCWRVSPAPSSSSSLRRSMAGVNHETTYESAVAILLNRISGTIGRDLGTISEQLHSAMISKSNLVKPVSDLELEGSALLEACGSFLAADEQFLDEMATAISAPHAPIEALERSLHRLMMSCTIFINELRESVKNTMDYKSLQEIANDIERFIHNFLTETYRLAYKVGGGNGDRDAEGGGSQGRGGSSGGNRQVLINLHNEECSNLFADTHENIRSMLQHRIAQYLDWRSPESFARIALSVGNSEALVRLIYEIPADVDREDFSRLIDAADDFAAERLEGEEVGGGLLDWLRESYRSYEILQRPLQSLLTYDLLDDAAGDSAAGVRDSLRESIAASAHDASDASTAAALLDSLGGRPPPFPGLSSEELFNKYGPMFTRDNASRSEGLRALLECFTVIEDFTLSADDEELINPDDEHLSIWRRKLDICREKLENLTRGVFFHLLQSPYTLITCEDDGRQFVKVREDDEGERAIYGVDEVFGERGSAAPPNQEILTASFSEADRNCLAKLVHLMNIDGTSQKAINGAHQYLKLHERYQVQRIREGQAHDSLVEMIDTALLHGGGDTVEGDQQNVQSVSNPIWIFESQLKGVDHKLMLNNMILPAAEAYVRFLYGFDEGKLPLSHLEKDIFNFESSKLAMKIYLLGASRLTVREIGQEVQDFLNRPTLYLQENNLHGAFEGLDLKDVSPDIHQGFNMIKNRFA